MCWWLLGYGFAFGDVNLGYLGTQDFAGVGWKNTLNSLHATTVGLIGISVLFIINCAISERAQFHIYLVLSVVIMLFAWPVVVAWGWGGGWLFGLNDPFEDDGGVCTVHLFAGTFALAGVIFLQNRIGRWTEAPVPTFKFSNPALLTAGTVLYFIHLCFVNALHAPDVLHRGMAVFNTWLAAGVAALVAAVLGTFLNKSLDRQFVYILRGFIAGAVGVASVADNCAGWEAFCVGVITGVCFIGTLYLLDRAQVDDVAYVTAVHFVPGLIGTFWVGLWDNQHGGFHWASGGLLGSQLAGELSVFGWAATFALGVFGVGYLVGMLKVSDFVQEKGLDDAVLTLEGFQTKDDEVTLGGIEAAVVNQRREAWGSS